MHHPLHIYSSHHRSHRVALCRLPFSVSLLLARHPFSHLVLPLRCSSYTFPHSIVFKRHRLHPSRPTPPPCSNVLFPQFQTENNRLRLICSPFLQKPHASCVPDFFSILSLMSLFIIIGLFCLGCQSITAAMPPMLV